jgi:hypothetical protein
MIPGVIVHDQVDTPLGVAHYTAVTLESRSRLVLDEDLLTMMRHDNGLINQSRTKAVINRGKPLDESRDPGLDFRASMENPAVGSVAFCPSNGLWQLGEDFFDGQVRRIANDPLRGGVGQRMFVQIAKGHWTTLDLSIVENFPPSAFLAGFTLPAIVQKGQVMPLERLASLPQVFADPRRLVKFDADRLAHFPDFFQLIRPVMPNRPDEVQKLLRGEPVRSTRPSNVLSHAEYQQLAAIINDFLPDYLSLSHHGGTISLAVLKGLPRQQMPLNLFGIDRMGRAIVICVDGRGKSAGISFEQAGELLQNLEAEWGGIGAGGGDTALVQKGRDGNLIIHNRPSNKGRALRRVPNILIFEPK